MATHSKLNEFWALGMEGVRAIFWSAVELFLDGLFWRTILGLGRACRFVSQLIETFHAVARAPPLVEELPSPQEPVNLEQYSFVKQEGKALGSGDPPPQAGNWTSGHKHEQGGAMKGDIPMLQVQQPHVGPGIRNRHLQRENVEPSAPLDPELEPYIPHFHCDIYCHRPWKKYYAVYSGRQPGIYNCWECVKWQVDGYSGQDHKSFPTLELAEEQFRVKWHCRHYH